MTESKKSTRSITEITEATHRDIDYITRVADAGLISSPCLELGAAEVGPETNGLGLSAHFKRVLHKTSDTHGNVDDIADLEFTIIDYASTPIRFSALATNILEHVFEPIGSFAWCNAARSGGTCVVITPVIRPLHYYPLDCWRINPALTQDRTVPLNFMFEYVGRERIQGDQPNFPFPASGT